METKKLLHEVADYGLDSDGLMSWEEFYGSSSEDLVGSILEMYDLLIGRSSEIKEEFMSPRKSENGFLEKFQSPFDDLKAKDAGRSFGGKSNPDNWCDLIKKNWNCRCTEKSVIEAITRCAACNTKEPEIRSTVIRDALKPEPPLPEANAGCQSEPSLPQIQDPGPPKCELVTCPAGFSTPTTPVQQRLTRLAGHSPLTLKRSDGGFRYVTRPSSVSSLASSSSSSSSGTSSCFGARRLGVSHKSSAYLASIESLEDDSDIESPVKKNESFRSGKESEGSEDSGVHSPCTSIPQDRPKYCDPHLSYMDKVVMEIIQTEEVYVGDLQKIIEGYLLRWRSLPGFPLADRLNSLFGNIEAIFHFNSLFLTELEQCGLDPVKVARCFVKNNSGFSVYTEYCTNYPRTVSLLTELMRQEGTVRLFRERQTALQHTLPLGSYLLKPVQRILKYHLLLQNIVKQYSMGFDGYKDIVDALRTMTEIAQHINDMKRRHEHEVRVQEIQSLLLGWEGEDLTTFGELCAEGAFRMYGAKAIRHVFLFDKMVLITKKKEGGILSYKTHINCSNLMLIESVPGEPLSFHIIPFDNPKLQYTLQCRNLEQKREWTLQLKRVILENYNAVIPSHARQLVMELGQNRAEDENFTTKILPKRPHLAPEYLEKRKQDKRKTELSLKSRLQKNKKLEAGGKIENQLDKPRIVTEQMKNASGAKRRQSEPDMHLYDKDRETEGYVENAKESRAGAEPPEKIEINTLEQIVAQILKQNREFDKILKRNKQNIIVRSHEFASRRRKKREESKTLSKQNSEKDLAEASDSDYATLLGESQETPARPKDFQRSQSYADEFESRVAEEFSSIAIDEDAIPTSPSVWLRQQGHHLPTPTKKAGSLPRSFQISSDSSSNDPRSFRDFRVSIERPFTIASDKLPSTMLFEGMERYCKGQFRRSNSDTTEDGSLTEGLTTPGASLDHINIHPEYKIYKSSMSAGILKNVITSVQSTLSHIKAEMTPKLEFEKKINIDKKASRVVGMLAKQYHKSLRNKQKGKSVDSELKADASPRTSEAVLPEYRQGSSWIGARLANFSETEYRINRVWPSKKAAALLGVGTDSVLSLASAPACPEKSPRAIKLDVGADVRETSVDESTDIYERTFEAMDDELLQEAELQDPAADGGKKIEDDPTPPPVPVKPSKELIIEKIAEMSEKNRGAVFALEMKREEEGDTSSQHSTASTVIEIKCPATAEILSKGWVKHVVGKIQGEL